MQIEQAALIGFLSAIGPIILGLWQAYRGSRDRALDRDAVSLEKAYNRADVATKIVLDRLQEDLNRARAAIREIEDEIDRQRDIARAWNSLAHDLRSKALNGETIPPLPAFEAILTRTSDK